HILALKPATPVLTVSKPSGTATNDVMIAAVSVRPYTATITAPSGWTLVRRVDYTTLQTSSLAVYRKVPGAWEPSSYTRYAAGGEPGGPPRSRCPPSPDRGSRGLRAGLLAPRRHAHPGAAALANGIDAQHWPPDRHGRQRRHDRRRGRPAFERHHRHAHWLDA